MFQPKTDLASEAREIYREQDQREIFGVSMDKQEIGDVLITRVEVLDDNGANAIGKPKGKYVTLESNGLRKADADFKDEMSKLLAKELKAVVPEKENMKVLVVGLGNRDVTPDSLGPKVVSKVFVTFLFNFIIKRRQGSHKLVRFPGAMGTTGLEISK